MKRIELFRKMIDTIDAGFDLMNEYDSMTHRYGDAVMYQAESKVLQYIGMNEGITISEMAYRTKKTPSAYSQMIRKLRKKGLVEQTRNKENMREYMLNLTPEGKQIFLDHEEVENRCYQRTMEYLDEFSENELENYIKIQEKLNEAYRIDLEECRQDYEIVLKKEK